MMHLFLTPALLLVLAISVQPAQSDPCSIRQIPNGVTGKYVQEGIKKVYKEIPVGTIVEDFEELYIRCSDGFEVLGFRAQETRLWCFGGTWLREPVCMPRIYCKIPETPEYGSMFLTPKADSPAAGTIATFTCEGNRTVSGRRISTCLDTGEWTFPTPKCLGPCKVPRVPNGTVGKEVRRRRYVFMVFEKIPVGTIVEENEKLFLRCDIGFIFQRSGNLYTEVFCKKGKWSPELLCQTGNFSSDTFCEIPKVSKNGYVRLINGTGDRPRVGTMAIFSCVGHGIRPNATVSECLHTGVWSSPPPACFEVNCPKFTDSPGLIVRYSKNVSVNSIAIFYCSSSTANLVGQSVSICQENGTWSDPLPSCEGVKGCKLPAKSHGSVLILSSEKEIYNLGEFLTFSCPLGMHLTTELRVIMCLANGWSETELPDCIQQGVSSCKPPVKTAGSLLILSPEKETFSLGEKLHFSCPPGMELTSETKVIICLTNGWSGNILPSCKDNDYVSCPKFPVSPGLEVTYSENEAVGSIAKFSCSPSTRNLIGSPVSTCQKDGSWSSPLPSCEGNKCPIRDLLISLSEDVELDMTDVNGDFTTSGSSVGLKCKDNSVINGNSKALCGAHGKWVSGNYQCVLGCVLNIDPSSRLRVQPVKDSYRFGEFVVLSCPPGYEMTYDVERMMCLGTTWSDSLPSCKHWRQRD